MPLARRPTPSHDAAQVLVSFHQNGTPVEVSDRRRLSGGSRPNRPLAFANVNRPPQNRRRVWRACESCRKKKIKCDGSDPCQCCIDNGSECVYAGDGSRRGFVDAQVLDVYGKRLRALEDLVATLVDEQQRLASQLAFQKQETRADIDRTIVSTRQDDIAVPSGFPPNVPLPQSENITVIQDQQFTPITQLVPSENADTIDPELVSSSADESQAAPLELPNTSVGSILQAAHADKNEDRTVPTVYSDEYGMLAADGADGAKYVGLGATVWMMDDCSGIRSRVRQELLQKGHQPQESLLDQPVVCMPSMKAESSPIDRTEHLPPVPLMDTLIDTFFRKIYKLFPIIEAEDFRRQYLMLRCNSGSRSGFLELLYSVLAVSSPHMATDDPVWSRPGCSAYRCLDLGDHFYSLAVAAVGVHEQPLSWMTSFTVQDPSINTVTAFTLLGMHLTQLGKLNEAWRIVGHAVRLGYEMGLHRSPKRMGLPLLDIKRRCQLWWCLYVMDRLLALHLGRPLAIHDADSDVFFPSARPQAPGFVAMTHLCKLIGRIHQVVSTVEQAHKWNDSENDSELQRNINELWQDLQAWKDIKLPAAGVESSPDPSRVTERCVLLSTYCSAVHLLFRTYMPTPHRLSRLPFDQALHESFRVATECIEMTEVFLKHVPQQTPANIASEG
ncbi:fungal-specific transcription factor domain-containing protein [Aspergillus ambiguus]|uniref:transcription factor domain-containing protein n=1 Tax=Aspergillus ambiguus TaxID=176160 RepID=UPI003CCCCA51